MLSLGQVRKAFTAAAAPVGLAFVDAANGNFTNTDAVNLAIGVATAVGVYVIPNEAPDAIKNAISEVLDTVDNEFEDKFVEIANKYGLVQYEDEAKDAVEKVAKEVEKVAPAVEHVITQDVPVIAEAVEAPATNSIVDAVKATRDGLDAIMAAVQAQ